MANEAFFSAAGYIATDPILGHTPSGMATLSMRLAWTPRRLNRATGEWVDEPSCFATVKCFRKIAENGSLCLRKGEPVLVTGTLRIREYDAKDGSRRTNVDIVAATIGHDLARGVASFSKSRQSSGLTAAERQAAELAAAEAGDAPERSDAEVAVAVPGSDDAALADAELADAALADAALPPDAVPGDAAPGDAVPGDRGNDEVLEEYEGELQDTMEPAAAPF
jgi:single-strand DNA-binding protein